MIRTLLGKLQKKRRVTAFRIFNFGLRHILPRTRWGDNIYIFLKFLEVHKRMPGRNDFFNDRLYKIKVGGALERTERIFTSDKEFVKTYIAGKVGEAYNVPTLLVLRSVEDVGRFEFPVPCVTKPTHGCGDVVYVRPENPSPDREALIRDMKRNRYNLTRERNYKPLEGKLIVEPLLFEGRPVHDYKVFCVNGKARCVLYVNDRKNNYYRILLDRNWDALPVKLSPYGSHPVPPKPDNLAELLDVAERLAEPFDFVRTDFYIDRGKIYAGEITHCHNSAAERFQSIEEEALFSNFVFNH